MVVLTRMPHIDLPSKGYLIPSRVLIANRKEVNRLSNGLHYFHCSNIKTPVVMCVVQSVG